MWKNFLEELNQDYSSWKKPMGDFDVKRVFSSCKVQQEESKDKLATKVLNFLWKYNECDLWNWVSDFFDSVWLKWRFETMPKQLKDAIQNIIYEIFKNNGVTFDKWEFLYWNWADFEKINKKVLDFLNFIIDNTLVVGVIFDYLIWQEVDINYSSGTNLRWKIVSYDDKSNITLILSNWKKITDTALNLWIKPISKRPLYWTIVCYVNEHGWLWAWTATVRILEDNWNVVLVTPWSVFDRISDTSYQLNWKIVKPFNLIPNLIWWKSFWEE